MNMIKKLKNNVSSPSYLLSVMTTGKFFQRFQCLHMEHIHTFIPIFKSLHQWDCGFVCHFLPLEDVLEVILHEHIPDLCQVLKITEFLNYRILPEQHWNSQDLWCLVLLDQTAIPDGCR